MLLQSSSSFGHSDDSDHFKHVGLRKPVSFEIPDDFPELILSASDESDDVHHYFCVGGGKLPAKSRKKKPPPDDKPISPIIPNVPVDNNPLLSSPVETHDIPDVIQDQTVDV